MAKRKTARATGRKTAGKRASRSRSRAAGSARKRKKGAAVRSSAARRTRAIARKTIARKGAARKATRKVARKATRKARVRRATARTPLTRGARSAKPRVKPAAAVTSVRKVPALNRERRVVRDDDLFPTPPSSLDLDRAASSARTGRRELAEKFHEHTETSPALTGGDVDADWESAYTVGDEAPGGDNPTLDQNIVDDIGKAIASSTRTTRG